MLPRKSSLAVGDAVRYREWDGEVSEVQPNGDVYIRWTGLGPAPYFAGPYAPYELVRREASS